MEGEKILNRKIGQWYGAQAICSVLSSLNKKFDPLPNVGVCVYYDSTLYLDKVIKKSKGWTRSVIVFVPVMLGVNKISNEYHSQIIDFFKIKQNIGLIGGES